MAPIEQHRNQTEESLMDLKEAARVLSESIQTQERKALGMADE
jgi:hypothetical protein